MIRLPYNLRRSEGRPCKIPHWGGLRYKFECICENSYIKLARIPKQGLAPSPHNPRIIISLTTYPARIKAVALAIKSIMLQSVKPDRIILWLAKTQFENIPQELEPYIKRGLEVRFCNNLRSHKKYFFALQEQQPNEVVITYDDDIIYEKDSIKKLIHYHRLYPHCIICNRAQKVSFDKDGLKTFSTWPIFNDIKKGIPTLGMIPSTGNGCLYPYGIMPPITFNRELIEKVALTADDLWIGFVNINSGNRLVKTLDYPATLINVGDSQHESLTSVNDLGGENIRVVNRLLKVFPKTLTFLLNEN